VEACQLISRFAKLVTSDKTLAGKCSKESWIKWQMIAKQGGLDPKKDSHLNIVRFALLDFIADLAHWNNQATPEFLETARLLTKAAHVALGGAPDTVPMVVDPFAGGGAIPLEAVRLGLEAFAGDLNPLAVLLNKVVLEFIPKYGARLSERIKALAAEIKRDAATRLAAYYPADPDGSVPLTYLWARTIRCEGPGCGYRIPLIRTLRLGEGVGLRLDAEPASKSFRVSVVHGHIQDRPTVKGGSVSCPAPGCNFTTLAKSVKKQLIEKSGGAKDAQLLAVLVEKNGERRFRTPSARDEDAAQRAANADLGELPTTKINPIRPHKNTRGLSAVTRIGISRFVDLYTHRQLAAIRGFSDSIKAAIQKCGSEQLSRAALTIIGLSFGRLLHQNCSCSRWRNGAEAVAGAFGKQALQVTWDFAETTPLTTAAGGWDAAIEWALKVIDLNKGMPGQGTAVRAYAQECPLPNDSASVVFTDPPYFAAIPYADLANFFYVWERPFFADLYPELFQSSEIEQEREVIVTEANVGPGGVRKDEHFFRREMTLALTRAREVLAPNGIGVIVFADSRTSSWEALLGAVVDSGWVITASWPLDTEHQNRTQAQGSASLQSSVHLVVRPREDSDGVLNVDHVGDWRDVLAELPRRMHEWMPRLQREGVVGADAIFACLGPALEGFSRYSRVEKPNGEVVQLREYLEQVWAAVSREALSMIFAGADTTGFEEDARLTAMWLWTLSPGIAGGDGAEAEDSEEEGEESDEKVTKNGKSAGYVLEYDAARKIAQGLGVHLEQLVTLVEIKGDTARLLPVAERTKALFGKEGTESPAARRKKSAQLSLPGLLEELEQEDSGWTLQNAAKPGSTTLDRLHQAMILFAAGRGEALRRFLVDDGVGKDPKFWRLAQSLCALYPSGTDERRWAEGVLARKKGLGL
jgi:adenine-specific DNA methylase